MTHNFHAIYRQYFGTVYNAVRWLGAAEEAIEDVVQEVFFTASSRLQDFRGESHIKTWLHGITLKHMLHYRRGEFRRRRRETAFAEVCGGEPEDDPYARREAADTLLWALDHLDDDRCVVFVLSELQELEHAEIAALLRININTVRSRLRVARERLERIIRAEQERGRRRDVA